MVSLPVDREHIGQVSVVVAVATVVLTWSFVGILAFVSGAAADASARLPVYVLAMAVVFVAAIFSLTRSGVDGKTAMIGAVGIGLFGLALTLTMGEGVLYTVRYPARVFQPDLLLYVLAAALITIGTSYWLLTYWRDFVLGRQAG